MKLQIQIKAVLTVSAQTPVWTRPRGPGPGLRGPEHQGDQKTLIHCRKHKTFTNRWEVHAAAREVTWRAGVGGVGWGGLSRVLEAFWWPWGIR